MNWWCRREGVPNAAEESHLAESLARNAPSATFSGAHDDPPRRCAWRRTMTKPSGAGPRSAARDPLVPGEVGRIQASSERDSVSLPTKTAGRTMPKERFAEIVASQIEAEVFAQGWPVGKVLGSEAELIERFGVSRAVFREAVRIVEHHNVARMRRGPGGGLVIAEPDAAAVVNAISVYLRYAGVTRQDLFELRITLELASVNAATARVDETGIARLRKMLEIESELGATAITTGHTHHMHTVIAELTGNPAMALFLTVLGKLNEEMVLGADDDLYPLDLDQAAYAYHRAHLAIVEAIAGGDSGLAQHRMRRHLEAIREVPD
jgi:DNA-binding FadR family transcriptional regulator